MQTKRRMKLIAFMQAQNCSNYPGSWRAPGSTSDFLTPNYFARIARTLEDAKFDLAFFDDRLAMPDIYGSDHELAVRHGIRSVKMDPTVVMMAMAMATSRLGVAATCSTTYFEPYHVARLFATLDNMTGGRVAWNVVTSLNDSEARNMGRTEHMAHDLRYDRADEFLEIVTDQWLAWDRDALVIDKKSGLFADPSKVHRTDYDGEFFNVHGTFPVPQSPQGHPVLLQAGASGRGMAFAARWADIVFTAMTDLPSSVKHYQTMRAAVEAAGRNPDDVTIAPAVTVIVGETEELALKKKDVAFGLSIPEDSLALLCEVLNVDLSDRPLDKPFDDDELAAMSWQGLRDKVIMESGNTHPSVNDFVRFSGRGELNEGSTVWGTPEQVADQLEERFNGACDGFVLSAATVPGSYDDFARLVVPVLQQRGLAQSDYEAVTLRDNLGLAMPERVR